ncbi:MULTISPECIES: hypothetical protein [Burkholderia]|uniref:hypothetical protein n=1 Tax=Burkholderia TaxID=32008 RepID=UPI000981A513|nr:MULTISPECIES: hypothetical protein [Burkholderia]AQQ40571.1 hypothetical protein A8E75_16205 [Burkholderia cenocepacia]ONV20760.1 hypothetical protein A8E78_34830 [Burkholderia cenocepacia]ONV21453.1 hypothetical protein A8E77_33935 [Burkholderia cenocepacia]ONV42269.1 hypothetical protein A8E82_14770 [Burkholderia cenocepacia]ONV44820.1 hypothetical protein A8E81_29770 [Burkholderia cenocepacia]
MHTLALRVANIGIGEHSAVLRGRFRASLGWFGLGIDVRANSDDAHVVSCASCASSAVAAVVEPTDEAWLAARAAVGVPRGNRDA